MQLSAPQGLGRLHPIVFGTLCVLASVITAFLLLAVWTIFSQAIGLDGRNRPSADTMVPVDLGIIIGGLIVPVFLMIKMRRASIQRFAVYRAAIQIPFASLS